MQLFVRSATGRLMVVAVDRGVTIQDLVSLCEDREHEFMTHQPVGGSVDKMAVYCDGARYLCYGGVPLRPQRTLEDYGIQNHATLETAVRLHGGCFAFSITLWIVIFLCIVLSLCTCGLSLPVAFCLIPIALLLPLCCL